MVMSPVHQVWPKLSKSRHCERGEKTRQTKEEVGRQHQGMDRPAVRQVPEGSGEQGKMEETGCEIICGAPTTLEVKKLMMMIMIMIMMIMMIVTYTENPVNKDLPTVTYRDRDTKGMVLRNRKGGSRA